MVFHGFYYYNRAGIIQIHGNIFLFQRIMKQYLFFVLFLVFFAKTVFPEFPQKTKESVSKDLSVLFLNLKYRNIGPYRNGRCVAVTGVPDKPGLYYMGSAGGGVWKSMNGGITWANISDGFFGGSIGAVAVSESNPNIIYVGGGEVTVRGNVSHGYGIWKSVNAGRSWEYKGLKEGQQIPRIRIHPSDPNLVYAAVLGHVFGPNTERGIYRSVNGGDTWEKVLYINQDVGGCDLVLNPINPQILYASTWRVRRTPYSLESGGKGSALWKSTNGGETWKKLNSRPGFPDKIIGIIGISISPVKPSRIWAIIEAKDGGLFRSDDDGNTWIRVNTDHRLRQRAWYFSRVYADPKDIDKVYVLNVGLLVSKDGGKNFEKIGNAWDYHDLWIDPHNPSRIISGCDLGALVSIDGGKTWTSKNNQPTGQFYRISTDTYFPYRIYAAQQDNAALRINHWAKGRSEKDWEITAGGESGFVIPDPENSEVVYGGSFGGYLARLDHKTENIRIISPWPDNPMGWPPKDVSYRFNWNFPLLFSEHNHNVLYAAANVLFKTSTEGQYWVVISPDLTRNDTIYMNASGGPITKDNSGAEYYGTITALAESHFDQKVIWTGSDDGMICITKNGGKTWQDVTPSKELLPDRALINCLEPSPFDPEVVYVAATAYKSDNPNPYILKTTDYGNTWKKIVKGINPEHFTRVIRADPVRKGLLFTGTESGMYISFNNGEHWFPFQMNLPVVPVTDLLIKGEDLILSTQGRGLWIIDDFSPLRQVKSEYIRKKFHLFDPVSVYRIVERKDFHIELDTYRNPGASIYFFMHDLKDNDSVELKIIDENNHLIRSFKNYINDDKIPSDSYTGKLTLTKGLNKFVWDMRYPGAKSFEGLILWASNTEGPIALPGKYYVTLVVNHDSGMVDLTLLKDPRKQASQDDLEAQFDFLIECREKLSEVNETIIEIRNIKEKLQEMIINNDNDTTAVFWAKQIMKELIQIENILYQTKNHSVQDPLNYPIQLNNKLSSLAKDVSMGDNRPTDQDVIIKNILFKNINKELAKMDILIKNEFMELKKYSKEKTDIHP